MSVVRRANRPVLRTGKQREAECNARVLIVRDGPTADPIAGVEALTGVPATMMTPAEVQRGGFERI